MNANSELYDLAFTENSKKSVAVCITKKIMEVLDNTIDNTNDINKDENQKKQERLAAILVQSNLSVTEGYNPNSFIDKFAIAAFSIADEKNLDWSNKTVLQEIVSEVFNKIALTVVMVEKT